jgi:hypothetical protein
LSQLAVGLDHIVKQFKVRWPLSKLDNL